MLRLCLLSTIIMTILKFAGVFTYSWLVVFTPIIAYFMIFIIFFGGFAIIVGLITLFCAFIYSLFS